MATTEDARTEHLARFMNARDGHESGTVGWDDLDDAGRESYITDARLVIGALHMIDAAIAPAVQFTEWAIRWHDDAPGYPLISKPKPSREEAELALAGSVFAGRIVKRHVRTGEWVDA
jgi:hypothetical protein